MTLPQLKIDSPYYGSFMSEKESRIVRCTSRMRMTFYPQAKSPVFGSRSTDAIGITFSADNKSPFSLRSFDWNKSLGRAAGQWQAIIKVDKRFSKLDIMNGDILPGDWVEIELLRNGVAIPVCMGIVDTINRDRRSVGGASVVHWQITGRDHGKLFEYPITYANIFAQTLGEIVNGLMTKRVKGAIGGTPSQMFRTLIEAAFSEGTTSSIWRLPPALAAAKRISSEKAYILDLLDIVDIEETVGHYYNEVQLWNKAGETLFQALQFWCFPLMHQMIFDVAEGKRKIAASIRMHPYINLTDGLASEWFSLDNWVVPSWCLQADNLARSENERFNIIQLLSNVGWEGSSEEQAAIAPPKYSKTSVERYGLRPFQESTHFLGDFSAKMDSFLSYRQTQQTRLMEWHAPNPFFLSGEISLSFPIPEARIGHRLTIDNGSPSDALNLYIEGARLEYRASHGPDDAPRASSSFTVTRGYKGTDQDGYDLVKNATSIYDDLAFKS